MCVGETDISHRKQEGEERESVGGRPKLNCDFSPPLFAHIFLPPPPPPSNAQWRKYDNGNLIPSEHLESRVLSERDSPSPVVHLFSPSPPSLNEHSFQNASFFNAAHKLSQGLETLLPPSSGLSSSYPNLA